MVIIVVVIREIVFLDKDDYENCNNGDDDDYKDYNKYTIVTCFDGSRCIECISAS